jgi:tetratricopeptide (TPR) repeat protein
MADYDAAISFQPDLAIAFNNRCVAQAILGRMAEAVSDCDRALQLSPDNAAFLDSRGEAFLRGHDYARAVADYDAAIKLSAAQGVGHASSYFGRGIAYSRLGKRDLAEQDFSRALALDPKIEAELGKTGLTR